MQVQTAKGPIETSALGWTLMHEHVFVLSPEIADNYDTGWQEEREVSNAIIRLTELKEAGIDTLVDLTVIGLGRYVPRIQQIAARVDLNIVVATGLYTYNDVPLYFHFRGPDVIPNYPEVMTEMFVQDIEKGIGETGVRAAILKCATDEPGVTRGVERVLRAVAQAHRQTGVPISTHTHAATRQGLAQQRIFGEEGVDLSRVVIGHSGDTTDIAYLEELMGNGSYIGMDRFGVDIILPFEQRVEVVAKLVERGHADRMVISHDAACVNDWMDTNIVTAVMPRWNYLHCTRDVFPALRAKGVSEEALRTMVVDNPRRIFEQQGGY